MFSRTEYFYSLLKRLLRLNLRGLGHELNCFKKCITISIIQTNNGLAVVQRYPVITYPLTIFRRKDSS